MSEKNLQTSVEEIKQRLFSEMTELGIMSHGLESLAQSHLQAEDYGNYTITNSIYESMAKRVNNLENLINSLPGGE